MTIRHTLIAVLAAAAVVAPAASADPHAQTAREDARKLERQDLRGERARDAAIHPGDAPQLRQDLRGERAKDPALHLGDAPYGRSMLAPYYGPVSPGHPSEAANTTPLAPASDEPLSSGDGGVDWATVGLGVAGLMLCMGGLVALVTRARPTPRTRAGV